MRMNKGLLSATINDDIATPDFAVKPILKYLKSESTVWCPFDTAESSFVRLLKNEGHTVHHSHIDEGNDFFIQDPKNIGDIDYIVSNPPFSIKDDVLERLYHWGIPFVVLLPITTLQGVRRFEWFAKHGLELLVFDRRINYVENKGNYFASAYFCKDVLPQQLIFEKLPQEMA